MNITHTEIFKLVDDNNLGAEITKRYIDIMGNIQEDYYTRRKERFDRNAVTPIDPTTNKQLDKITPGCFLYIACGEEGIEYVNKDGYVVPFAYLILEEKGLI